MLYTNISNYKNHRFINISIYRLVTYTTYRFNNNDILSYTFTDKYGIPSNMYEIKYGSDDRMMYNNTINNYIGMFAYINKSLLMIRFQIDTKYRHRSIINKIGSLFFRLL